MIKPKVLTGPTGAIQSHSKFRTGSVDSCTVLRVNHAISYPHIERKLFLVKGSGDSPQSINTGRASLLRSLGSQSHPSLSLSIAPKNSQGLYNRLCRSESPDPWIRGVMISIILLASARGITGALLRRRTEISVYSLSSPTKATTETTAAAPENASGETTDATPSFRFPSPSDPSPPVAAAP